ncbi:hypothetical protein A2422_02600 [Candidatus Woesebacteria bacterium RIFOXYC1_FULL_31_51]|uniref:Glycosyltransferase RgtA/B/C/D-like domain-containing protein n=1 Tax=Candidatus Woesebacteria bacterium GW2011_GWC2_31_9 TaxID=1618586 RepID=A0A0F9YJ64_9BACT|nr:MAG: hypothetical protein UR17_C0001G0024 [Candidatus Woesebacteria bacterium GW2011_GWF1_31_35]KKP23478.1 MAG: hypothetical protein UR11_C0001G0452 [Candidatus Woesebacteria bacterium GW2011_GWC1_30_29]KKP26455.1 MAG: hypothetical protein UR13_C0004G0069 [Candidatus Woesebacteria bacterium GW2011_GWD1_31_12]KKP27754.1 MAG: hypothetical protein UR16_C0002G0084 [Candidatus Woesebacteria bacterium GW2011_GWB1_31_29]KKP31368.1 MAG: hypothetical protein UR21_C0010G0010 [Candidatus Woesebacteria 
METIGQKIKRNILFLTILLLGSLSLSLTMVKSGLNYSFGQGFWGPNGHDGIWHIALSQGLARGSFENSVFSGELLKNYHIGFDLLLVLINKLTKIPISLIYFQILPPIFALLIGLLTYKFVNIWIKNKLSATLSMFFVYFGGSLSWILGKGESTFWSQQGISTLINPPFALSLIFILLGLIAILKDKKILAIVFFGLLIQIKVYAGLLVLGALLVSGYFQIFIGALLISSLIFIPFNKEATSSISWQPFWFLETMASYSDRLGWDKFYSAMTTYKTGHIWIKGILAYGLAFTIFIVGNFGTRIIFLFNLLKRKIKLTKMDLFFYSVILAGILIPTFFVQKGTPWNTIQFFYYSLFFSSILSGIVLSKAKKYIVLVIILLTIPTTLLTLKDVYIPNRPPAKVSPEELSALSYLREKPTGVVLTYPFDSQKAKDAINNPPRPLYLYDSTSYVSAYTNKPVSLEDEVNLDILGYNWKERLLEIQGWYKETDLVKAKNFLKVNNIKYVYWLKGQRAFYGEGQLGITKIFENSSVDIFQVE